MNNHSGDLHQTGRKYDLSERCALFGERVIGFCRKIRPTPVNRPLIVQLVKAGTSVGANYEEAEEAESLRDFRHKIALCRKESRESKYWLRMIAISEPLHREEAANLWQEAKELHLIFCQSIRTCDKKLGNIGSRKK